jgi:hypothetical protein
LAEIAMWPNRRVRLRDEFDVDRPGPPSYNFAPNRDGNDGAAVAPVERLRRLCSSAHNTNLWQNQHNPKMTYKLPGFTSVALLLALLANAALPGSWALLANRAHAQEAGAGQGSGEKLDVVDGSQLVLEASRRLMSVPLSAKVHHKIQLFDQTISGGDGGRYLQLGRGDRIRFEIKLTLGAGRQAASLVHVCNGEYLFKRRALPGETVITRLRLETVYDALEAARQTAPSTASIDWIALGGVPRLLQVMQQNFDFAPPRSGQFADRRVWVVEGAWKPEVLARFLPEQRDDILAGKPARLEELAPQAPTGIVLAFAADGEVPLFPAFLEYHRRASDGQPAASLVTLRFDDVRRRPDLTPDDFNYEITEQVTVVDLDPAAFIRGLGLTPVTP